MRKTRRRASMKQDFFLDPIYMILHAILCYVSVS